MNRKTGERGVVARVRIVLARSRRRNYEGDAVAFVMVLAAGHISPLSRHGSITMAEESCGQSCRCRPTARQSLGKPRSIHGIANRPRINVIVESRTTNNIVKS